MLTLPAKIAIALVLAGALVLLAVRVRERTEPTPASYVESEHVTATATVRDDGTVPRQDSATDDLAQAEKAPQAGTTLDLSGQNLTSVPHDVFERRKITTLDVSNNALKGALQAEVRQLQNLKVLDLSDNEFTGVPAEIGQLAKLEVLDLSNNNLSGLPYELGNLKNLKTLDLSGNANIAEQDLARIRQGLSPSVNILQ